MFRKHKFKKIKRTSNPYIIFTTFAVCILALTIAYALLSDTLNINIKANILPPTNPTVKSTYYYEITSHWSGSSTGYEIYAIKFYINNQDGDTTSWQIDMDLPDPKPGGTLNCWAASSVSLTGNTLSLTSQDWSGTIHNNSTYSFDTQLELKGNVDYLKTTNFIFNGKKLRYYNPNDPTSDANTTNNTNTSPVENKTENKTTNTTNDTKSENTTNSVVKNETTGGDTKDEPGNSTYNWENTSHWGGNGNPYTYAVTLNVTNLDKEYTTRDDVVISFDIPDGFLVEQSGNCNIWQAEKITLSGNRLSIKLNDNGSYMPIGHTITMYMQLQFGKEINFNLSNLSLNNKASIWKP